MRVATIRDDTEAVKMCGPYDLHILYATAKIISKYKIGDKLKSFSWRTHS